MALQDWLTFFFVLGHFASAPVLHYQTESFSAVISKDISVLCSVLVGVPSDIASPGNSLQIYYTNVHAEETVVATVFSSGEIKLGEKFKMLAPGTKAQSNITDGWLQVSISGLTENTLGAYKCVVLKLDGSDGHIHYNRSITVGHDSEGTLSSHPPGFQIRNFNYVEVQCSGNSGCFCHKTFAAEFSYEKNKKSVKYQKDAANMWCENNLKKPFAQVHCNLSVRCGTLEAQFNCTRKDSTSPFEFTCGRPVLSQLTENSTHNATERSLTPCGTQDPELNSSFSVVHLLCAIAGAFAGASLKPVVCFIHRHCSLFCICGFYFALAQYLKFDYLNTSPTPKTAGQCKKDDDCEPAEVPSKQEECQPFLEEGEGNTVFSEAENAKSAAESVMFRSSSETKAAKRPFHPVQDEEADIDTKSKT